jgi:transcriptional regulator with GAF, ATPase, and Fis domain
MKSYDNSHSSNPEDQTGESATHTDTLIKAALSLSQAITALGSLKLFGEMQPPDVKAGVDFYTEVRRFEVSLILEALRFTHGSQARAASLLGLNPTTLNCMIKRYDINIETLDESRVRERPQGRRAKKQPPPPVIAVRRDLASPQ